MTKTKTPFGRIYKKWNKRPDGTRVDQLTWTVRYKGKDYATGETDPEKAQKFLLALAGDIAHGNNPGAMVREEETQAPAAVTWKLADAKNRFTELVNLALAEGPQRVVRRDDAVIVLAQRDYDKLAGTRRDFKDFLLGEGPTLGGMDLTRDRSAMRDAPL